MLLLSGKLDICCYFTVTGWDKFLVWHNDKGRDYFYNYFFWVGVHNIGYPCPFFLIEYNIFHFRVRAFLQFKSFCLRIYTFIFYSNTFEKCLHSFLSHKGIDQVKVLETLFSYLHRLYTTVNNFFTFLCLMNSTDNVLSSVVKLTTIASAEKIASFNNA